jgi:CheY-like chemotaxis protein
MVIVGVEDLLFRSRIRATAQAIGTPVTFGRRRDAVMAAIREHPPTLVILDLDCDALEPLAIINEIQSDPALARIPLVGFAAHVHAERLQEARDAGCGRVMARSGFVGALPHLLSSAAGWSPA